MNFLSSLSTAVLNASSAALSSASGGVPGVQGYHLGDRVTSYDGKSIWSLYAGTKRDDSSPVSVFGFDLSAAPAGAGSHLRPADRKALLPLARNAFRKLRALRHPHVLKFLDGSESDSAVWIVTEPVRSLATQVLDGLADESKVYGLLHVASALAFLNRDGNSVHGGLRTTSVWVTPAGEWKLAGMEVCSRLDEPDAVMWHYGGLLPDSKSHASPEVRRGGWTALKEYDPSTLDSYLLHLFLYTIFNGPLPNSYLSPAGSETAPALPQARGSIPSPLFQPWRRLGNPNPAARLRTTAFLDLGLHPGPEGWWPANRLVKLSAALDGFALATDDERTALIRTLKAIAAGAAHSKTSALPDGFLKYKVLPSLVHTFEFSSPSAGSGSAAPLLPVILDLASDASNRRTAAAAAGGGGGSGGGGESGDDKAEKEYQRDVIQPIVRMFATPDRAIRMALLENLERYADRLSSKDVNEKVWPHLQTGFGDVVPVIREATVKAIPLIAPKLNDRILNNDLLRVLGKTQTDVEPGIRTNTCILLSRLSRHLQHSTQRKVLIPAFARAIRDPFVHARIAGLMALMATCEVFEKEDLAGKVIPAMSICLVDREKSVRDQAYRAIDMFVKKCEALTATMPDTVLPDAPTGQSPALQAAAQTQPGLATNAAGAAGALAGWAFASVSKKLSTAELAAPIERQVQSPATSLPVTPGVDGDGTQPGGLSAHSNGSDGGGLLAAGGLSKPAEDWGGDLMDVHDDDDDWNEFETGTQPPLASSSQFARVDPLAARLSATGRPKPARGRLGGSSGGGSGSLRLGAASKNSSLRLPMDMDATDSWDLDGSTTTTPGGASSALSSSSPKKKTIPRAAVTGPAGSRPVASSSSSSMGGATRKPIIINRGNDAALLAMAAAPLPPPPPSTSRVAPEPAPEDRAGVPSPSPPPQNPWTDEEQPPPAVSLRDGGSPYSSSPPPAEVSPFETAELAGRPSPPSWSSHPLPPPPESDSPFAAVAAPVSEVLPRIVAPDPLPVPVPAPAVQVTSPPPPPPPPPLQSEVTPSARSASPAVSIASVSTTAGGSSTPLSKEEKAARLAQAREERKARMAAAKAQRGGG